MHDSMWEPLLMTARHMQGSTSLHTPHSPSHMQHKMPVCHRCQLPLPSGACGCLQHSEEHGPASTSSVSAWPLRSESRRRAPTSCEAARRVAAELALSTTVGGDMPRLAGALLGTKALAGPCRLQLRRLSAGSAEGAMDPAQPAVLSPLPAHAIVAEFQFGHALKIQRARDVKARVAADARRLWRCTLMDDAESGVVVPGGSGRGDAG